MALNFIKLQRETIKKVVDLSKSFDGIEAIFIMGSHAKDEESSFSDIDIGLVFSDPERQQREEIFNKVADLYPSLCVLWLYDKNGLFLYQNGVRLDLDFLTQKDLKDWGLSKVKIVYDPHNKYRDRVKKTDNKHSSAPKPKWRDEDGSIVDWFFWMFRQAYCYIRRGETNEKRSFNKFYSAQTSLSSIREKLLEMKIYINGKHDYMTVIDKDFAKQIALTFTDLNPNSMTKATKKLFELFVITAKQYCEKTNKEFPENKVLVMHKLFDEFDNAG